MCKRCDLLEARVDKLLADASEERKLMGAQADRERAAFASERAEWTKERAELLTRIQSWDPKTLTTPIDDTSSQRTHEAEAVDGVHSQAELDKLGLRWDAENEVYYDVHVSPPVIYETYEDCIAMRKFLVKKGLPESTHPGLIDDLGFGAMVAAAREAEREEIAKENADAPV